MKQSTWFYTQKKCTQIHTERIWFTKICKVCQHWSTVHLNVVTLYRITWGRRKVEIHSQVSLLRGLIIYINTTGWCCLLSEAWCSKELHRGCNDRLIPVFVECDKGGGKGGAESSLPAEPTNTSSQWLPRRRAIVPDSKCGGPLLWDVEAERKGDGRIRLWGWNGCYWEWIALHFMGGGDCKEGPE